jgi:dihydroneopterin aldolase/2-amino-4-hydroxy-6-hydroxymethyldihydropteridine diphosphokinase
VRVAGPARGVGVVVAGLDASGVRPGPDVDLLEGPW